MTTSVSVICHGPDDIVVEVLNGPHELVPAYTERLTANTVTRSHLYVHASQHLVIREVPRKAPAP